MKTLLFFIILILNLSLELLAQKTFKFDSFELNKTVTFNNVVNLIKDKNEIITEPSVYIKGEDIVYYNYENYETTLKFFDNTQILKQISIFNITDYKFIKFIKDEIFKQLGQPHWGYEINEFFDVKDNSLMKDFNFPNCQFSYLFPEYEIKCSISGSGSQIIYDFDKKKTEMLLRQGYEWAMGYNKFNIVYSVKPMYCFIINITRKGESNYNKNNYPYDFNIKEKDYEWAKVYNTLINKW